MKMAENELPYWHTNSFLHIQKWTRNIATILTLNTIRTLFICSCLWWKWICFFDMDNSQGSSQWCAAHISSSLIIRYVTIGLTTAERSRSCNSLWRIRKRHSSKKTVLTNCRIILASLALVLKKQPFHTHWQRSFFTKFASFGWIHVHHVVNLVRIVIFVELTGVCEKVKTVLT